MKPTGVHVLTAMFASFSLFRGENQRIVEVVVDQTLRWLHDVVIGVNSTPVQTPADIVVFHHQADEGTRLSYLLLRSGSSQPIDVTLAAVPATAVPEAPSTDPRLSPRPIFRLVPSLRSPPDLEASVPLREGKRTSCRDVTKERSCLGSVRHSVARCGAGADPIRAETRVA